MCSGDNVFNAMKHMSEQLQPLLPLANCHMVDFLTCNLWDKVLPRPLARNLLEIQTEVLCKILAPQGNETKHFMGTIKDSLPALHKFLSLVHSLHLDSLNVLATVKQVYQWVGVSEDVATPMVPLGRVMREQKIHEVERMSSLLATLCNALQVEWLFDLGSGKGYLSSVMSRHYNMNVLAIDCSASNVAAANTFQYTLQKELNHQWNIQAKIKSRKRNKKSKKTIKENIIIQGNFVTQKCKIKTDDNEVLPLGNNARKPLETTSDLSKVNSHIPVNIKNSFIGDENLVASLNSCSIDVTTRSNSVPNSTKDCNISAGNFLSVARYVTKDMRLFDILQETLQCQMSAADHVDKSTSHSTIKESDAKTLLIPSSNQLKTSWDNKEDDGAAMPLEIAQHPPRLCVSGLHTCGDLAASVMRVAAREGNLVLACGVPCCYHLLSEAFEDDRSWYTVTTPTSPEQKQQQITTTAICAETSASGDKHNECSNAHAPSYDADGNSNADAAGFPLSGILTKMRYSLGRNARMIAAQPVTRLTNGMSYDARSQYWRAMLQLIIVSKLHLSAAEEQDTRALQYPDADNLQHNASHDSSNIRHKLKTTYFNCPCCTNTYHSSRPSSDIVTTDSKQATATSDIDPKTQTSVFNEKTPTCSSSIMSAQPNVHSNNDLPASHDAHDSTYLPASHGAHDSNHLPASHDAHDSTYLPASHDAHGNTHLPASHDAHDSTHLPASHGAHDSTHLPASHDAHDSTHLPASHGAHDGTHLPASHGAHDSTHLPASHGAHDSTYLLTQHRVDYSNYLHCHCPARKVESQLLATFRVGRGLSAKADNFSDYVSQALQKLPESLRSKVNVSCQELLALEHQIVESMSGEIDRLTKLFLLRACLGPIVEGLILLDRLVFWLEQDCCTAAFLLPLFDPLLSPRSHAIVAFKRGNSSDQEVAAS